MSRDRVTSLDQRTIDRVLGMGSGYVLDFRSKSDFNRFFEDFDINIDAKRYHKNGSSMAKRLRTFLQQHRPPLTGRVLASLLQHRYAQDDEPIEQSALSAYIAIIERLGGEPPPLPEVTPTDAQEEALLALPFRPETFDDLPLEPKIRRILLARMEEAKRCMNVEAWLASVILCGSVLEGMCLGVGQSDPSRTNQSFQEKFKKEPPHFGKWKLNEWIEVLSFQKVLSPQVRKFSHGLRDFRNYVHPNEELKSEFSPNKHTASIAFQVVVAAAEDILNSSLEKPEIGRKVRV